MYVQSSTKRFMRSDVNVKFDMNTVQLRLYQEWNSDLPLHAKPSAPIQCHKYSRKRVDHCGYILMRLSNQLRLPQNSTNFSSTTCVTGYLTPGPPFTNMLTLITTWLSNDAHYEMWDKIIYPFTNFNGASFEDWEWASNFMPSLSVITYWG